MVIKYFSHPHYLDAIWDFDGRCSLCGFDISRNSPSYGCEECKFYLHEYCARLQREIQHPHHPSHPLSLTHRQFFCDDCGNDYDGFSYHCPECDFDLDLECALKNLNSTPTITFHHEGHELVLYHLPTVSSRIWSCFICNEILELPVFKCKDHRCSYVIHFHCAPLEFPKTIQHKHIHPLAFSEKFTEDDSGEYYCDACEERRHPYLPVYSCVQCSSVSAPYTAHMACVLSHQVLQLLAKKYERSKSVSEAFQHHHHHLIVRKGDKIVDKIRCTVCKSSVDDLVDSSEDFLFVGPRYRKKEDVLFLYCPPCEFLLHYDCIDELEREIKHPTHPQHSLTLHVDATHVGPFFRCNAGKEMCLCFIYRCSCCNFNLCVRCIRAMQTANILKYEEHQLFLFSAQVGGVNCDYCNGDNTSLRFICMDPGCTYNLHFLCAPLSFPKTIEPRGVHSLLTLKFIDPFPKHDKCWYCDQQLDEGDPLYCSEESHRSIYYHESCALLEILPELIAKFENSTNQVKVTRLNAEIQKLQEKSADIKARRKAIECKMIEADDQLTENLELIEAKKIAILKLRNLPNASSE